MLTSERLRLDREGCIVVVDGMRVRVSAGEAGIIEALMLREGEPLTREVIVSHVEGALQGTDARIVDVLICRLGMKLKSAGVEPFVERVWGRGYMIPHAR